MRIPKPLFLFACILLVACKKEETQPIVETSIYPIEFTTPMWSQETIFLDIDGDSIDDIELFGNSGSGAESSYLQFEGVNGWQVSFEVYNDTVYSQSQGSTIYLSHSRAITYQEGETISETDPFTSQPAKIVFYYRDPVGGVHLNPDTTAVGNTSFYGFHKAGKMGWLKVQVESQGSLVVTNGNVVNGTTIIAGQ